MIYDNILQTIGNTPIVRLNRMGPDHVELYVKVESFNPLASYVKAWPDCCRSNIGQYRYRIGHGLCGERVPVRCDNGRFLFRRTSPDNAWAWGQGNPDTCGRARYGHGQEI